MFVSKTVGEFRHVTGNLIGYIASGEVDLPRARLRPISSRNPRAPKFELEAMNRSGRWVPYGGLFLAIAKHTTGEIFYSGELDDNGWSNPFQIALFGTVEQGFRASWRRDDPVRGSRGARNRDRDDEDGDDDRYADQGDGFDRGGNENGEYSGGFGGSTAPMGDTLTGASGPVDDDEIPF